MDGKDRKPPDPAAGMAEGMKDVTDEADLPSDGMVSGMDIISDATSTNTQQQPQTQTGPDGSYPQGFTGQPGQFQDSGQHTSTQGHGHTGQQVPPYPYPGQHWQGPGQGQPGYPYPYPQQGGENPYTHIPPYDARYGHYDYRYGGYIHPQTGALFRWPDPYGQQHYPQPDGSQQQNLPSKVWRQVDRQAHNLHPPEVVRQHRMTRTLQLHNQIPQLRENFHLDHTQLAHTLHTRSIQDNRFIPLPRVTLCIHLNCPRHMMVSRDAG
ncbi:glutenin, high molecular weight subunit DX5-like [Haliotis rubra]|uniref:glutenin, high molecular weight subunit DX5-like n=1 Tax=Haliotis rubra TaxID=36100 RepID=UPI001EE4FE3E|nr:glutenin, high molecular weight subunit DX5-like [Haliotis rubra]